MTKVLKTIGCKIDVSLYNKIINVIKSENKTKSEFLHELITNYFEQYEHSQNNQVNRIKSTVNHAYSDYDNDTIHKCIDELLNRYFKDYHKKDCDNEFIVGLAVEK